MYCSIDVNVIIVMNQCDPCKMLCQELQAITENCFSETKHGI